MLKAMGFRKGINLGGWMSQCNYTETHLDTFITEPDFAQIATWGFDHVRIPVDYNILQQEDGTLLEEGFVRIDRAMVLAEKYGLKTVLDLHKTAGFSFDYGEQESGFFESEKYQELFFQLWDAFAKRYGSRSDSIVFELLNEVTDQKFSETWNHIADTCIRRIRQYAPETVILVGSYFNNAVQTVSALHPPLDDHVIYNFHCYEPLPFTHQGATWAPQLNPDDRIPFAESGVSADYFEQLFADALETAKKQHTSLYCGEYGIIQYVSAEEALAWFRIIHAIFEKYGIARAVWCYKGMHFGIADARFDGVRDELLQLL